MVLDIRSEWSRLEDYMFDLRKKYRRKVNNIIKETSDLEIRNLSGDNLEEYAFEIQGLFDQVVSSSRFKGAQFNTDSFAEFVRQGFMRVNGYFLKDGPSGNNRNYIFSKEK